jgi:hypothetical protein
MINGDDGGEALQMESFFIVQKSPVTPELPGN